VDGDLWKRQRKAGAPFFSNANLKDFVNRVLPPYLKDMEKRLEDAASNTDPIDMQDVFLELTTRLMGEIAYNVRVNPMMTSKCPDRYPPPA
jgi:cytochrome P450